MTMPRSGTAAVPNSLNATVLWSCDQVGHCGITDGAASDDEALPAAGGGIRKLEVVLALAGVRDAEHQPLSGLRRRDEDRADRADGDARSAELAVLPQRSADAACSFVHIEASSRTSGPVGARTRDGK